jgi:REP element-mobilizing transposase RayT
MPSPPPLEYGATYHIYNRGTNGENVFLEQRNYRFFLERYTTYIEPVAFTHAYCLMKNHFHLLVRTKTREEQEQAARQTLKVSETFRVLSPSQQFANLFNSYAKAFNRSYGRTGSLFEHPFHRIEVTTDAYFAHLVTYIHQNPQLHGFVDDFREWPFSSYHAILSDQATRVQRDATLAWFGGRVGFSDCHGVRADVEPIASLLLEELD